MTLSLIQTCLKRLACISDDGIITMIKTFTLQQSDTYEQSPLIPFGQQFTIVAHKDNIGDIVLSESDSPSVGEFFELSPMWAIPFLYQWKPQNKYIYIKWVAWDKYSVLTSW